VTGRLTTLVLAATVGLSTPTSAQIIVSANDGKAVLVDGVNTVPRSVSPDTLTIFDASVSPARVIGELRVPNSVVGPPQNVAITPDGSLVLVASANQVDPADATKIVPDDRVTVIDLRATSPTIIATLRAGRGASGVAINSAGTLALVANRSEGTVSVFALVGRTVTPVTKVDLGAPDSGPSQVQFTPDGRMALVTRNNDHVVSVLTVSGTTVQYAKRDIVAGLRPYGMEITPDGSLALVANIGAGGTGGYDTISVIDLKSTPLRAIDHVTVGITPEALSISPDGRFVAVTVMNGSNQPKASAFRQEEGRLRILRLSNRMLTPVTEAPVGQWCQGVAWTRDSQTVWAQCMVGREIQVFRFDGRTLTKTGTLKVNGGPAGIRAGK
jgi:DNA-binding beta-propeller fold protein YncE